MFSVVLTWFLQSGEIREKVTGSGKVREFKSTISQKLTKMEREKFCQNFFCSLCSQIICTFTFKFDLLSLFLAWWQAIENQHQYFARAVSQGKRFILSWKVREKEFYSVVGTMR